MIKPIVALIHATRNAIEPINEVFTAQLAQAEFLNFLDEAMLRSAWIEGVTSADVLNRMGSILVSAEKAGARLAVTSCTSLSPAIDRVCGKVSIPVLRIEVPLAEEAVSSLQNVGVVVTSESAIEPFKPLLEEQAEAKGKLLRAQFHFCEGAFAALSNNNPDLQDRIVLESVSKASRRGVDAILLPQVSITRIVSKLPVDLGISVLSSVYASVNRVRETMKHKEPQ